MTANSIRTDPDTTGVTMRRSSGSQAARRKWSSEDTRTRLASKGGAALGQRYLVRGQVTGSGVDEDYVSGAESPDDGTLQGGGGPVHYEGRRTSPRSGIRPPTPRRPASPKRPTAQMVRHEPPPPETPQ